MALSVFFVLLFCLNLIKRKNYSLWYVSFKNKINNSYFPMISFPSLQLFINREKNCGISSASAFCGFRLRRVRSPFTSFFFVLILLSFSKYYIGFLSIAAPKLSHFAVFSCFEFILGKKNFFQQWHEWEWWWKFLFSSSISRLTSKSKNLPAWSPGMNRRFSYLPRQLVLHFIFFCV